MDMQPVTLSGSTVILEPLATGDAAALAEAAADGELWNITVTTVPRPEAMQAWVDAALAAQAAGRELPFVIRDAAARRVLGSTRYRAIALEHRRLEIGNTWLRASAQRTAANTECKLLLMGHAFDALGCNRVEFITDVLNERSRVAILRLGATQEGVLRHHMVMPGGRVRDSAVFSLLRDEWPAAKARLLARLREAGAPS
jgi:RimJ/RimL family protein N-acetyltransferase